MQSNKAPKKTRKDASEPVSAATTEVSAVNDKGAKPRTPKSSPSKSETIETASAKRHLRAATVNTQDSGMQEQTAAPKAMAAAAGVGATTTAVVTVTAPASPDRIQELAYQFWLADSKTDGNHIEHWIRAERELGAAR